jgi:hypothetical protein
MNVCSFKLLKVYDEKHLKQICINCGRTVLLYSENENPCIPTSNQSILTMFKKHSLLAPLFTVKVSIFFVFYCL